MRAKIKLFKNSEYRIVNLEDSTSSRFATLSRPGEGRERSNQVITYGLTSKARIWADNFRGSLKLTTFACHIQNTKYDIHLPLPGKFNVLNALAAISVGQIYQIPKEKIKAGLEKVKSIPGRMEYIDEGQDFLAMVDFAHTPNALKNLLEFLRPQITGKIILVFGSAGERDAQKRPEMGRAADGLVDLMIITREDNRSEPVEKISQQIANGIQAKKLNQDYFIIPDRREAIRFALSKAKKDDIVVITGKGHEQSLNIDGREIPWDDRKVLREEIHAASH